MVAPDSTARAGVSAPQGLSLLEQTYYTTSPGAPAPGREAAASQDTASPGALVPGREAAASILPRQAPLSPVENPRPPRGRTLLPRQAPLSPIEKPRPHRGCVLYCFARRPCPRWTSRGLPGGALYTASPGTRVPGREAVAFQGTLGYYSASPGAPVPGRAATTSGRHQPPGRASAPLDRGVAGVDEPETLS
jgi:hypothetical protein